MVLKTGDTIGIIALSGDCDRNKVVQSKSFFENLGYNVKLSKNIYSHNRYLAGSDEDKLQELEKFFLDDDIKLILCARGGYGAIRLVNNINYNIIKSHPKPFCGYSDVTALLLMIYKKTNVITYHSPMACTDFTGNNKLLNNFLDVINNKTIRLKAKKVYKEGSAKGVLWGGNLATTVSLCGLDFIPNRNFIFFAEDINEPVYKIDKMFQQLINIKKFTQYCKGIILGDFIGIDNEIWLEEYFNELSDKLNIPLLGGFKITHKEDKITLPVGKLSEIRIDELCI